MIPLRSSALGGANPIMFFRVPVMTAKEWAFNTGRDITKLSKAISGRNISGKI